MRSNAEAEVADLERDIALLVQKEEDIFELDLRQDEFFQSWTSTNSHRNECSRASGCEVHLASTGKPCRKRLLGLLIRYEEESTKSLHSNGGSDLDVYQLLRKSVRVCLKVS